MESVSLNEEKHNETRYKRWKTETEETFILLAEQIRKSDATADRNKFENCIITPEIVFSQM